MTIVIVKNFIQPPHAWFLEIVFVREVSMRARVCVCWYVLVGAC